MSRYETSIVAELRERGLRVTAARHAVLEWLIDHPHATADQVHQGVSDRLGAISKQAVYDVLAACVTADLVRQIKPAGHPARFERHTHDNHHHLVCRGCGRIEDTDCHMASAPCLEPLPDHGFEIDEAEVVFWGWCRSCQDEAQRTKTDTDLSTHA
ncbi:Fur family transcriptional regulator [Salinisphaera hydrothermalis]|uniref:Fur family transcriptional regulator n=1 Tax=Salinisphaera hydrothermalis TaxID=563188 RepID=UPI0033425F5C